MKKYLVYFTLQKLEYILIGIWCMLEMIVSIDITISQILNYTGIALKYIKMIGVISFLLLTMIAIISVTKDIIEEKQNEIK